jgi:hypothetical protein
MEERLEWLTDGVSMLNSLSPEEICEDDNSREGTEVVGQKLYFDGTIVEISSEPNMDVSKQLSDTDSSSGCRENQLDFISQEGQQESGSPLEGQNDLATGTATQCDTAEEPDNCVSYTAEEPDNCVSDDTTTDMSGVKTHELNSIPVVPNESDAEKNLNVSDDATTDVSGVKTHELDSTPVIPNESDTEKNWDFSHEIVYDGELDIFVNDTILPLIRSRLSEGSESPPRYGYDT